MIYIIIIRLCGNKLVFQTLLASFIASLCFAVTDTFWSQSVISEVYTLNMFLISIMTYLLIIIIKYESKDPRNFYYFSYILAGLHSISIANHHTSFLLLPIILFVIFYKSYKLKFINFTDYFFLLLIYILFISIYIYLPLRSAADPAINWGNPQNLTNFLDHVLRRQYGKLGAGYFSLLLYFSQLKTYISLLIRDFTLILSFLFLLLITFTVYKIIKRQHKIDLPALIPVLLIFIMFSFVLIKILNFPVTKYEISLVQVFFIPSYFAFIITIGVFLNEFIITKKPYAVLAVIIPIVPFISNYSINNCSNKYIGYEYGTNIMNTLNKNGIIFVSSDNQKFTLSYLHTVEKTRNDLQIYDETGCAFKNIFGDDFKKLPRNHLEERRNKVQSEFINDINNTVYHALGSNMRNIPNIYSFPDGIVFRAYSNKADKTSIMPVDLNRQYYLWKMYNTSSIHKIKLSDTYMTREVVSQYFLSFGDYFFLTHDLEKALKYYNRSSEIAYDIAAIHNNLGIHLALKGFFNESIDELNTAILLNPEYDLAKKNLFAVNAMKEKKGAKQ